MDRQCPSHPGIIPQSSSRLEYVEVENIELGNKTNQSFLISRNSPEPQQSSAAPLKVIPLPEMKTLRVSYGCDKSNGFTNKISGNIRRSNSLLPNLASYKGINGIATKGKKSTWKKEYQVGMISKRNKKLGICQKENLVVQLSSLGFSEEAIQAAVFGTDATRVEEAVEYIVKSEDEKWEHKFIKVNEVAKRYGCDKLCTSCIQKAGARTEQATITPYQPTSRKVLPAETHAVHFVHNGVVMKNQRYQQFAKHRSGKVLHSALDISYLSELQGSENTNDDLCFVCGDCLENHSPDFNLELFDSAVNENITHSRILMPLVSVAKGPKQPIKNTYSSNNIVSKPSCIICFEPSKGDASLKILPCGHSVCVPCLHKYITFVLDQQRHENIKCPECCKVLSNEFLTTCIMPGAYWKKYCARQSEISLFKAHNLMFCPRCSKPLTVNQAANDMPLLCDGCGKVICRECQHDSHEGISCAENASRRYQKLVRGWEWQTCPNCKAPVKMASQCKHMMCKECSTTFCIYCRRKGGCAGEGFRCGLRERKDGIMAASTGKSKSAICWILLLYLLIVLTSPILAIILIPYIVVANFEEYLNRKTYSVNKPEAIPRQSVNTSVNIQSSGGNKASFLNLDQVQNQNSTFSLNITNNNNEGKLDPNLTKIKEEQLGSCICLKLIIAGTLTFLLAPISLLVINVLALAGVVTYIIN